jgi:ferredoxin/DMSO/TMAO reductase YedYZ heme-binding membrane subunit
MLRTAQDSVHLVAATIGFISYAALWTGTLWGSVLRSGWATSRLRHQTVYGIHMHLILLGLTLGIAHGIVQMAAPYGKVRAIDVVVPFIDRADPIGVGLGVLALELMIATALSVLLQRKLGYGRWRALHSLGYLSFTMVAAHLLISGSELYPPAVRTAIAASWAVVVVAGVSTVTSVARMPRAALDRLSRRHRAEEVTVSVDPGKCGQFGFCEHEAPGIFTLRSDQRLAYRSVVPSDQAEAAMRAAVVCPARAIKLGRLPATVVVSQPTADTTTVAPLAASLAPHTGPQPAVAHSGSLARMAAAVDPHTGSQPRIPAPSVTAGHTGSQPRVTDTGSFPPVAAGHTGSQPRIPAGHTGPQPHVPTNTGSFPPVHPGAVPPVGPQTGALPPVGGPQSGSVPRLAPVADAAGHTGPQPTLRPVAGRPASRDAAQPGIRSVGRRAAADPPPEDPLPAPDQLQDTGRHHLPRLRGIAGGRS